MFIPVLVLITSLLCAGFTLAATALYVKKIVEPRLRAAVEQQAEQLAQSIEERVQAGVEAGIQSGIEKAATADTLVRATRTATRSGASLVEDGLNVLLGTPRRDK